MTPLVEEIKDALRACRKVPEVNACVLHYAADVAALEAFPDRDLRTMAIQIKNLAAWKRREIIRGERTRT